MQFRHATIGAILASAVFVSACNPKFDETIPNPFSSSKGHDSATKTQSCPAKDLQYLVGQPRTVLQTMRFGGEVRFEEPGQVQSQEFIGSRTRIVIGPDSKIARVVCG